MWEKVYFCNKLNNRSSVRECLWGGLFLAIILAGSGYNFARADAGTSSSEHCGRLVADEYWTPDAGVQMITCDITIPMGVTLTIAPGTIIKLAQYAEVDVRGTLNAVGTSQEPIVFTSMLDRSALATGNVELSAPTEEVPAEEPVDDVPVGGTIPLPKDLDRRMIVTAQSTTVDQPAVGDWGNIQFIGTASNESRLAYAVIRYSGSVYGIDGGGTVTDGAIELSDAAPTLSHITFEDNYINGAMVSRSTLAESVWDNPTVVYVVDDADIVVSEESSLEIGAGQLVKFAPNRSLSVRGNLNAVGSVTKPVYFTSLYDDSVCGTGAFGEAICDTNNDESSDVEQADTSVGSWGNIKFHPESSVASKVAYAVIRFSGNDIGTIINDGAILLDDASPTLQRISFESNYINGVELKGLSSWQGGAWHNPDVVHVVQGGDITVAEDASLVIEPGTKLKFMDDTSLLVHGHLNAVGRVAAPITFTSALDERVCGVGVANEPICNTFTPPVGALDAPKIGDWGHIRFNDSSDDTSIIDTVMIRYSGSNRHTEINDGAIYLSNAAPILRNITFENNYINGVELAGFIDWQTTTWQNQDIVYVIEEGDFTIAEGHRLTIAAGMKVMLGNQRSMIVRGTLIANGTVDGSQFEPVIFSSIHDGMLCGTGIDNQPLCEIHSGRTAPEVGDWGKIFFRSGSTGSITRSVVRYSGGSGTAYDNAAILLDRATPTLENITLLNNRINGVSLYHLTPWTDSKLSSNSVIYVIHDGDLTVDVEQDFSVAADVKIKIGNNRSLLVDGGFSTAGTLKQPVIITSMADDSLCGVGAFNELICDTDNESGTPSVGDWGSIHLRADSGGQSKLAGTILRYAGDRNGFGVVDAALLIDGAWPTISYSTFEKNYRGIEATGGANPILLCNNLEGNIDHGIYNDDAESALDEAEPIQTISAFNHWWGSEAGPMHGENLAGDGDRVSDGVTYKPWRDERCTELNTGIDDNRSQNDGPNESVVDDDESTDGGVDDNPVHPLYLPMVMQ